MKATPNMQVSAAPLDDAAAAPWTPHLRDALLESRERWRDMVALCADFAFETDRWGRLVFVYPDPALGWPASTLLGQPADLLLAQSDGMGGFNPFRAAVPVRRRRAWLRGPDGVPLCLSFAVAPMLDAAGQIIGVRGVGQDITREEGQDSVLAARLRRGEVVEHILTRMRQEVLLWRGPEGRAWDSDDLVVVSAAAGVIRMVLEHESIQQEMSRQARRGKRSLPVSQKWYREFGHRQ